MRATRSSAFAERWPARRRPCRSILDDVKAQVREVAKKEIVELPALNAWQMLEAGAEVKLNNWDSSYYRDKLCKSRYNIDREALRAYFPTKASIEWVMHVSSVLYGVEFRQVSIPSWHSRREDVGDARCEDEVVHRDALSRPVPARRQVRPCGDFPSERQHR